MTPLIVIGLIVGLPVLLVMVLRSNAAIVFLALCTGSVAQRIIGSETSNLFGSTLNNGNSTLASGVQLSLLLLPALLTAVFLRKNVSGAKSLFNILPAIATGVITALLAVPLLPSGLRYSITGTPIWSTMEQYQAVIVGTAVLVSLLILWTGRTAYGGHKKHH